MRRQILFTSAVLILALAGPGCSMRSVAGPQAPQATEAMFVTRALPLADYPPSGTPYYMEGSDFWLVHTPAGRLLAFAPVSPTYKEEVSVDECRFVWSEPVQRFIDPCSGDDWELDGRLHLVHSTELWSTRDLNQHAITVEDGVIYVHLNQKKLGAMRVGTSAP